MWRHLIKAENLFSLSFVTRGNEAKCKGVVENVDVHFCRQNFSYKLDLGNKYEEAGKEGKDCCPQHVCYMKKNWGQYYVAKERR